MRREEFAGLDARAVLAAEPRDPLALGVDHGKPRSEIRHLAVDRHAGAELADDEVRMPAAAAMQCAGAVQIIPLRLVSAVAVEYLHPVVLAIGNIDVAIRVSCDVVHDVELAGIRARLAPGLDQFSVRCVFVDAGVAVAVGDVDLALRRQRGVGAAVEGGRRS